MLIGISFKLRTMRLGEFWWFWVVSPCCCSSLAVASVDSRLANNAESLATMNKPFRLANDAKSLATASKSSRLAKDAKFLATASRPLTSRAMLFQIVYVGFLCCFELFDYELNFDMNMWFVGIWIVFPVLVIWYAIPFFNWLHMRYMMKFSKKSSRMKCLKCLRL